jgi:hypothetical protein
MIYSPVKDTNASPRPFRRRCEPITAAQRGDADWLKFLTNNCLSGAIDQARKAAGGAAQLGNATSRRGNDLGRDGQLAAFSGPFWPHNVQSIEGLEIEIHRKTRPLAPVLRAPRGDINKSAEI